MILLLTFLAGFYTGANVENATHALKVSQLTGTSYVQVLAPVARLQAMSAPVVKEDETIDPEREDI
jgi:hypothetical protein